MGRNSRGDRGSKRRRIGRKRREGEVKVVAEELGYRKKEESEKMEA